MALSYQNLMATRYYCTLFDSFYLPRGVAMIESLAQRDHDFHLYVFAFDDSSLQILKNLKLAHVTVISLAEFETPELLQVKPTRSKVEYCWTCTPAVILHCLEHYKLPECTYLDADLLFFSS